MSDSDDLPVIVKFNKLFAPERELVTSVGKVIDELNAVLPVLAGQNVTFVRDHIEQPGSGSVSFVRCNDCRWPVKMLTTAQVVTCIGEH